MHTSRKVICALAALAAACAGSETAPKLTVDPPGPVTATGPVLFTASPASLAASATWVLAGPGTLSGTSGAAVTYRPPLPAQTGTATLTATAGGQTATIAITLAPAAAAPGTIPGLAAAVTVDYDAQDIPHVFCAVADDCFAVQGYLQARDRLFEMDLFRRTARGSLASLVGPLEVGSDEQFLTFFLTRDGQRIEDQLVAALDTTSKAHLDAFTKGVNAYLAWLSQNPTFMPGEYAQLPSTITPGDIPAWSAADTLAIARLQQFQLSESIEEEIAYGLFAQIFGPGAPFDDTAGRFTAYVRAKQPIAGYTLSDTDPSPIAPPPGRQPPAAGAARPPDLTRWLGALGQANEGLQQMHAIFGARRLGTGSNNWVVDGAHSASGKAMVANDPHLSLYYPPLFHLAAMTSADGALDITGGSFPGIPGALVGRGKHVGWGVTVVGYDVTDVYLETLAACPGGSIPGVPCVSFNGGVVQMIPAPYTIKVKGAADQHFTALVVPHHGPVIHLDAGAGTAISFRWTGHEVTHDLKAFLDLYAATAVGDGSAAAGTAFAALKNYGTGAQNFVLADDQGNIGYDPHALVPKRGWFGAHPTEAPWFPLPGDGTAEWGTGNAADHCAGSVTGGNLPSANCWVDDALLPQGVNPAKGYLATANSDPAGYTDTNNPIVNPVHPGLYLSFDWDDPTDLRYARIAELLKAKTANGGKVSLADMQAIQTDHSMLVAKLLAPHYPDPAGVTGAAHDPYAAALALFTTWAGDDYDCPTGLAGSDPAGAIDADATRSRDSAACLLFHTFAAKLLHRIFDDEFALASAAAGQRVASDRFFEVRALFYMLGLPPNDAGASFCNDIDLGGNSIAHACGEHIVSQLATAYGTLSAAFGAESNWRWGRVHTMTTVSPAAPLIAGGFAAGPYARPGGFETVDVGNPSLSQSSPLGFTYSAGSNVRHISVMDPAAPIVKMQLPGPERDTPHGIFSSTPDLIGSYVQNGYFDYLAGHQVDAAVISTQGFTAQ